MKDLKFFYLLINIINENSIFTDILVLEFCKAIYVQLTYTAMYSE
jgi:hypothetical protein